MRVSEPRRAPSRARAAKTGTLRYANALAGYVSPAKGGERLAFAILLNHHTVPGSEAVAAIDEIAVLLSGK